MPKLNRKDWEILRERYKVAFRGLNKSHFDLLLDKVYGNPGKGQKNSKTVDKVDALMFSIARTEPPIPPWPQPR